MVPRWMMGRAGRPPASLAVASEKHAYRSHVTNVAASTVLSHRNAAAGTIASLGVRRPERRCVFYSWAGSRCPALTWVNGLTTPVCSGNGQRLVACSVLDVCTAEPTPGAGSGLPPPAVHGRQLSVRAARALIQINATGF